MSTFFCFISYLFDLCYFLKLEVPCGFLLNAISSVLGNENSINFQVGFTGPCQAMEGILAVGLDILVAAT